MRYRFPFHTWLVAVFFSLHIINEYYALLPGALIAEFAFYYLLLSAILLAAGRLLFNNMMKASIWATVLMIVFCFFGAAHDNLKKLTGTSFLGSYKVVLPLLFAGVILFSWYIRKRKQPVARLSAYLSFFFGVLCLMEIVLLCYKKITNAADQISIPYTVAPGINNSKTLPAYRPDIFFIVFDEYASTAGLAKYCGYDNSTLDSILHSNRFYIASHSKSNYNYTPFSISSTFNLHYFNKDLSRDKLTLKTWMEGWYSLQHSRLPQWLAAQGYQVHNYGVCNLVDRPILTTPVFYPHQRSIMYQETLWGRIERDILWNIYDFQLPFFKKQFKKNVMRSTREAIDQNRFNYQSVLRELNTQGDQPKFVFAHIMMPHLPFVLDHQGHLLPDSLLATSHMYNKDRYLEQLVYSNTWIDSIAQASNRPWPRPRIVIVEGDHGYRDTTLTAARDIHFMNLNSYYFSDHDYSLLYDSISPVNSFRVAFNKYFHTRLPLLKDSTIYTP
jgi:hypothetical protein